LRRGRDLVSAQEREKIARLWINGMGVAQLARRFGYSYSTVWNIAKQAKRERLRNDKNLRPGALC
jgi:DNA-binding CsgD family transcriptional regulator